MLAVLDEYMEALENLSTFVFSNGVSKSQTIELHKIFQLDDVRWNIMTFILLTRKEKDACKYIIGLSADLSTKSI